MRRIHLFVSLCFALFCSPLEADPSEPIHVGDSVDKVLEGLGAPTSQAKVGTKRILNFDECSIVVENGVVTKIRGAGQQASATNRTRAPIAASANVGLGNDQFMKSLEIVLADEKANNNKWEHLIRQINNDSFFNYSYFKSSRDIGERKAVMTEFRKVTKDYLNIIATKSDRFEASLGRYLNQDQDSIDYLAQSNASTALSVAKGQQGKVLPILADLSKTADRWAAENFSFFSFLQSFPEQWEVRNGRLYVEDDALLRVLNQKIESIKLMQKKLNSQIHEFNRANLGFREARFYYRQ